MRAVIARTSKPGTTKGSVKPAIRQNQISSVGPGRTVRERRNPRMIIAKPTLVPARRTVSSEMRGEAWRVISRTA